MASPVPPLLAVSLVFRAKTQFLDVPHLVDAVSVFLDTSVDVLPLQACKLGTVKLLDRIWNSSEVYTQGNNCVANVTFSFRRFLRTDSHYQHYFFTLALKEAVPSKKLEVVRWILKKFPRLRISSEVVARACLAGALEILDLFYENSRQVLEGRGKFGVGHPVEWGGLTMSEAVLGRRSDVVWWLHHHFPYANSNLNTALESALNMGDILIAEWLVDQGAEWRQVSDFIDGYVANQGRLDVLQWMDAREQIEKEDLHLMLSAAKAGHFQVARWVIEVIEPHGQGGSGGTRIDTFPAVVLAIHTAASHGHLEIAKFLRECTKEVEASEIEELNEAA